jgi:hypothetical protein
MTDSAVHADKPLRNRGQQGGALQVRAKKSRLKRLRAGISVQYHLRWHTAEPKLE